MALTPARRERIEQLADLLDGRDVDVRPEVRRLAHLAGTVATEVSPAVMTADARDRVRDRVLAELHLDAAATPPRRSRSRSPRLAVATGLASVLVAASGLTVAAQEALPGDALYSIKRATETVRVAVASDLLEVGRLELTLAEQRLAEVQAATARGDVAPSRMVDALADMDLRSWRGVEALAVTAERSGRSDLVVEAARFTDQQAALLTRGAGELPVTVRPYADGSVAELRAMRAELLDPLLARCEDCTELGLLPARSETPPPLVSDDLPVPGPEAPSPGPDDAPPTTDTGSGAGDGRTDDGRPGDGNGADGSLDDGAGVDGAGDGGAVAPPTAPPPTGSPPPTDEPDGAPPTSDAPPAPTTPAPDSPPGTPRRVVPRLPGPLDEVGGVVDGTVGGAVDGLGRALDGVGGTVGRVVEDPLGTVGGLLEDPLGTVGDVVGGVTDGLGGLLGSLTDGLRPRG